MANANTTPTTTETLIVATYYERLASLRALGFRVGRKDTADGRVSESRRDSARHAAYTVLGPIMDGINGWLVLPRRGESIRAYARRASRCAAARCAEIGVSPPAAIAHDGAETVAMAAGYAPRHRSAVREVSRIERMTQD